MVQWEVSRRQVALSGLVINAQTQELMAGVLVTITDAPDAFVTRLMTRIQLIAIPPAQQAAYQKVLNATTNIDRLAAIQKLIVLLPISLVKTILPQRFDQTYTAQDGHFYFLDLPDGNYTLAVSQPRLGSRYGKAQAKTITVKRDINGTITPTITDPILLSPTTLKGQITGEPVGDPVVLAEIRVQGSGEVTFSDRDGNYRLTALETSDQKRTVAVKAIGFQPTEKTVLLNKEGSEKTLNFALKK